MTERHARRARAIDPRPAAGSATADAACPHDPLRRRPRARRARAPGRGRRACGCSRSPTTTTSAGYRELRRGDGRPRPASTSSPASRSTRVTRGLGLVPGGELHVLGLGCGSRRRGVRGGAGRAAGGAAARDSTRRLEAPARARASAWTRQVARARPHARRRARPADGGPGPDRGRVTPTSVEDAFARILGCGMPGYVPRQGLGPGRGDPRDPGRGRARSLAHFPEATTHLALLRELVDEGLNGLESHHSSFKRRARAAVGAVARVAGPRGDRGHRLPRRLGPVRGATRVWRADALVAQAASPLIALAALAARRRLHYHGARMATRALPVLDIAPPVAGAAGPRDAARARGRAPRRVPARGPRAAVVLRLDARLPDEQERLRGDGRAPAGRGLRRGGCRWTPPTSS